jgi:large subunit ribosomal protein L4
MKVDVLNMKGEKVKSVELPAEIFESPVNIGLMHQAYIQQMANARLGTHKTKTRSEVSGGGKKPWKQKGTGRARQGSTRAPQWVHGGKIHTPRPHKYKQHMPLKMRRAALRSALSAKVVDSGLVIVDELTLPEPRTRLMAEAMNVLVGSSTALILVAEKGTEYDILARSTNNLPDVRLLMANYLNIRDVLGYDKLVMPLKALDVLKSILV